MRVPRVPPTLHMDWNPACALSRRGVWVDCNPLSCALTRRSRPVCSVSGVHRQRCDDKDHSDHIEYPDHNKYSDYNEHNHFRDDIDHDHKSRDHHTGHSFAHRLYRLQPSNGVREHHCAGASLLWNPGCHVWKQ